MFNLQLLADTADKQSDHPVKWTVYLYILLSSQESNLSTRLRSISVVKLYYAKGGSTHL